MSKLKTVSKKTGLKNKESKMKSSHAKTQKCLEILKLKVR